MESDEAIDDQPPNEPTAGDQPFVEEPSVEQSDSRTPFRYRSWRPPSKSSLEVAADEPGHEVPSRLPGKPPEQNQAGVAPTKAMAHDHQPNNPLHGVKLADILKHLVEEYGWEELGFRINIRCFTSDPSVKSSLKFLRQTPWARAKVERLYRRSIR